MENDAPPPPYSVHDPVNISRPGPPQQPTVFSSLVDVASNLNLLVNPNNAIRQASASSPITTRVSSWTSTSNPTSQPSYCSPRLLKKRPSEPPAEDSLLHQLVAKGKTSQVKLLLEKGVEDIEGLNKKAETPLFVATSKGDKKTVELLLEYGADPLTRPEGLESCLHVAVKDNRKEIVRSLVSRFKGKGGIEAGIEEVNAKGETPLYVAVQKGNKACIEILLDAGANPMARPRGGDAMIHLAVKQDSCEIAKMLLRKGVYIEEMKDGETPLYRAISKNSTSLTKVLLSHGASAVTSTSKNDTPLSLAVSRGDRSLVSLLLAQPGVQSTINHLSPKGQTPLWLSIYQNHTSIAEILLRSAADPCIHPTDSDSCLNLAISKGSVALVHALLEKGADFEERDKKGESPVMQAVNRGDASVLSMLLSKGANANAVSKDGEGALMRAVEKGNTGLVSLLCAHGADVNMVGDGGETVLFIAVSKSNTALVSILLANKANPSAPSAKGHLPLEQAISNNNTAIVSVLLSHGADVGSRTKDGSSMYEYAVKKGDRSIMSLMEVYNNVRGPKVREKDIKC